MIAFFRRGGERCDAQIPRHLQQIVVDNTHTSAVTVS